MTALALSVRVHNLRTLPGALLDRFPPRRCVSTLQSRLSTVGDPPHLLYICVVGLLLSVEDAEKLTQARGFESQDPFLLVSKQDPSVTAVEDGGDEKPVQPELACEADGVALPAPV